MAGRSSGPHTSGAARADCTNEGNRRERKGKGEPAGVCAHSHGYKYRRNAIYCIAPCLQMHSRKGNVYAQSPAGQCLLFKSLR